MSNIDNRLKHLERLISNGNEDLSSQSSVEKNQIIRKLATNEKNIEKLQNSVINPGNLEKKLSLLQDESEQNIKKLATGQENLLKIVIGLERNIKKMNDERFSEKINLENEIKRIWQSISALREEHQQLLVFFYMKLWCFY